MTDTSVINLNDVFAAIAAHNWLAVLLFLAVCLRTIVSDKSKIPLNISANWRPVIIGVAGGIITDVTAMQSGMKWGPALLSGLAGLVVSGTVDAFFAACFGKPENAPYLAKLLLGIIDEFDGKTPPGGSGTKAAKPVSVPPLNSLPPTSLRFRAPLLAACLAASLAFSGCAWWSANSKTVVTDLGKLGSCIAASLFGGATDAGAIVKACDGSTFADVEQVIASLIDYYQHPPTGSAAAVATLCGSGDTPFKGAPQCATVAQVGLLHSAHASARMALERGDK